MIDAEFRMDCYAIYSRCRSPTACKGFGYCRQINITDPDDFALVALLESTAENVSTYSPHVLRQLLFDAAHRIKKGGP